MRGDGTVYLRKDTGTYWIAYWHRGRQFREPGGRTEAEARKRLKARLREIHGDKFVGPQEERIEIPGLLDDLIVHLKAKDAKSIPSVESHLKPVRNHFALTRAVELTSAHVERFTQSRRDAGKAPATVNKEIGALKQAFNLARKQGRLARVPYFPMLTENNVREGFFERAEFEAVAANLPETVRDIAWFGYLSGWRKGEILPLTWNAVDRVGGEIRLGTSKNGRPRMLPIDGPLSELIERRWTAREYQTPDGVTRVSPYVFHNAGRPVVDFRKAWAKACKASNVSGRLFHDLRRTAARDMVRAGVPQSVAKKITGHETDSMFNRYNITSGEDMRRALQRTAAHRETMPTERNVAVFPSETTPAKNHARNRAR